MPKAIWMFRKCQYGHLQWVDKPPFIQARHRRHSPTPLIQTTSTHSPYWLQNLSLWLVAGKKLTQAFPLLVGKNLCVETKGKEIDVKENRLPDQEEEYLREKKTRLLKDVNKMEIGKQLYVFSELFSKRDCRKLQYNSSKFKAGGD